MSNFRFTKTFTQSLWYRRQGDDGMQWEQITASVPSAPLDQQVAAWVRETGAVILHPGQLGIHTQWYDRELTLKCITLGLTVLYTEDSNSNAGRQIQETGQIKEGNQGEETTGTPFLDPDTAGECSGDTVADAAAVGSPEPTATADTPRVATVSADAGACADAATSSAQPTAGGGADAPANTGDAGTTAAGDGSGATADRPPAVRTRRQSLQHGGDRRTLDL